MAKESALYQLMKVRMNGVMNGITNGDREYQEIIRKSDEYSGKLNQMELPEEARLLIDRYVSEQNALGSRYGMLAYLPASPTARRCSLGNACPSFVFKYKSLPPVQRTCWISTTLNAL